MDYKKLIKEASLAREKAYAPYSKFKVGASIMSEDGSVFSGCNVENASYGATNCAERTAIFKAVSEGKRKINAIAIVGSEKEYTYPCGVCRQVMSEFCNEDMEIILAKNINDYVIVKFEDIFKGTFSKKDLI